VARARQQLKDLGADLLATGAQAGEIRADMPPGELAGYCLHSLTAAVSLPSEAAVRRLLAVTMFSSAQQPHCSPCQASAPSLTARPAMPSATTGSSHHQPRMVLASSPASTAAAR
jgi:hypothetical protein